MEINRRAFFTTLGGAAALQTMSSEAKASALEAYMTQQLDSAAPKPPKGTGSLFTPQTRTLEPMPEPATLVDFFRLRFAPASHVLQSATRAMKMGQKEETILACLLHDTVLNLIKPDHGWWGAQLYEPYVPEKVSWGIRYHQALRFYPDPSVGYEYPEMYNRIFGEDYKPDPYVEEAYKFARNHPWYMEARMITVHDDYSFDKTAVVSIDPFIDIIGRHFKQPKEGLGYDGSPVAHMWRTIANPNRPL